MEGIGGEITGLCSVVKPATDSGSASGESCGTLFGSPGIRIERKIKER